jgi:hypothetical protein
LDCDDPHFRVTGDDPAVLERTCRVAAQARKKLATCSVLVDRPIEFTVRDRVEGETQDCLALYRCGEDKIEILSPSAMSEMRDRDSPFAPIPDTEFWDSIIAHELTHAAYDRVPCPFSSCTATAEYASYAMQVWSMPNKEQQIFGRDSQLRIKPTRDAISAIILALAPDRFALISWRHFEARPDPCGYMQTIMEGDLYFDREPF